MDLIFMLVGTVSLYFIFKIIKTSETQNKDIEKMIEIIRNQENKWLMSKKLLNDSIKIMDKQSDLLGDSAKIIDKQSDLLNTMDKVSGSPPDIKQFTKDNDISSISFFGLS